MDVFDLASALPSGAALVQRRSVSVAVDLPASGPVTVREQVTVLFADGRWSCSRCPTLASRSP